MRENTVSPLALGALWFGAAVSMAELEAGALLAVQGAERGMAANLIGHLFGAVLLFAAARLSVKKGRDAIEVCGETFGPSGPRLFGILNFVQLVGWTAVMILAGARNMEALTARSLGLRAELLWRLVLGLSVLLMAIFGLRRRGAANLVAAGVLAALCLMLSLAIFFPELLPGILTEGFETGPVPGPGARPPFGAALELAVLMPVSWLPLIGDYVNGARRGRVSCLAAVAAYSLGSLWMYALGLFSFLFRGLSEPVGLLGGALAFPALGVVLLSTMTTAFLDVRSAGISLRSAFPGLPESGTVLGAGLAGLLLALAAPMERYQSFLGLIGSVFAPLYGVLFADFLLGSRLFPRRASTAFPAFGSWGVGVILYAYGASRPTPVGTTIPTMAAVAAVYILVTIGVSRWKNSRA